MNKTWTDEELDFIRLSYKRGWNADQISRSLGRTVTAVRQAASRNNIRHAKYIKQEELRYIENNLGKLSPDDMADKLGWEQKRMFTTIEKYFGTITMSTEKLTATDCGRLIGVSKNVVLRWCKRGLIKSKKVGHYRFIRQSDFLSFLQEHPERYDATKCEKWYFEQFDWFNKKRADDFNKMVQERWGKAQ